MFRVLANHPHHSPTMDDLALITNLLHRCPNLHNLHFRFSILCYWLPATAVLARLLISVNNPSAIQIVRTQFHCHPIARKNADKILPHPSRNVGQHFVPAAALELHFEHRIRQRLKHRCHHLNRVFFRQSLSLTAVITLSSSRPGIPQLRHRGFHFRRHGAHRLIPSTSSKRPSAR